MKKLMTLSFILLVKFNVSIVTSLSRICCHSIRKLSEYVELKLLFSNSCVIFFSIIDDVTTQKLYCSRIFYFSLSTVPSRQKKISKGGIYRLVIVFSFFMLQLDIIVFAFQIFFILRTKWITSTGLWRN